MQKQSNKNSKNKELNIKFFASKDLMSMAKKWLRQFSNKHKNDTSEQFSNWLLK